MIRKTIKNYIKSNIKKSRIRKTLLAEFSEIFFLGGGGGSFSSRVELSKGNFLRKGGFTWKELQRRELLR